ncbi:MAG: metallophosphoesterase [Candidatus Latescibacteria bacterium]|nr:metallophosphoesterase [Candidatus Latescibacterota bacterium]
MKRRDFIHTAGATGIAGITAAACSTKTTAPRKKLFSFVHFSDIHVQPERGATEGFLAAIEKMNSLKPDIAISGGDLVMDSLGVDEQRAVMLYDLYIECSQKFDMPLHNVMGNHEVFGIYVPDKVPEAHPDWGKVMFKKRLGEGRTYRSFDHKGVHFVLLDSIGIEKNTDKPGHHYIGEIGDEQMNWLRQDLAVLQSNQPIIALSHIPLYTLYPQITNAPTFQNGRGTVITDGKELYDLFAEHNLLAYFFGHIHVNETFIYKGSKYIDTGAVSGGWWAGARDGHPEGFNLVHVYADGVETEYVTYGWDASKYKPADQAELQEYHIAEFA